jgi:hypothetical protein
MQTESNQSHMSDAARRVLHIAALREGLPLDGWEHYATAMGDDAASTFHYDREDGRSLIVRVDADGHHVDPRSLLAPRGRAQ